MNVIPLFISLFLMISCTNKEQIIYDNQTASSQVLEKKEKEYLYALEVYYVSAVAEIDKIKLKKAALIAELENGNEDALQEIELLQKELEKLNRFKDNLLGMKIPRAPKPIKMPPIGCLENGNCNPMQNLTNVNKIVLGDSFKILNLEIRNTENDVVGKGTRISNDSFGQRAIELEANFTGQATMITTLEIENVDRITLSTPVIKNN